MPVNRLADLSAELSKLRVKDLKARLAEHALKLSGRKAVLVTRLAQFLVEKEEQEQQQQQDGTVENKDEIGRAHV